jgi:hypothetical protein
MPSSRVHLAAGVVLAVCLCAFGAPGQAWLILQTERCLPCEEPTRM